LALAEANDPVEFLDAAIEDVGPGGGDGAEAEAPAGVSSGCAPDLLSQVGQDRIRRFGCPHCGGHEVGRWGRANALPGYRCKGCRKTFSPLTGTPLAGLRYRERWMDQAEALISGESVAKAASALSDRSHHRVSLASSLSFRSQFRQARLFVRHRRG
jgi:transposase-like protein